MESPEPSARLLELLDEHFLSEHAVAHLSRKEIRYLGQKPTAEQKAIWNPGQPNLAASFGCLLCPLGTYVPAQPGVHYGDATRSAWVLAHDQELQAIVAVLDPAEGAEYIERYDRGEFLPFHASDALSRLNVARRHAGPRRPRRLEEPLTRILERRVAAGEGITSTITDLAHMARDAPLAFTCIVGRELGVVGSEGEDSEALADATATVLGLESGVRATIAESTLWFYWSRAKQRPGGR
jgi:hypothetical protein